MIRKLELRPGRSREGHGFEPRRWSNTKDAGFRPEGRYLSRKTTIKRPSVWIGCLVLLATSVFAQGRRLWVLRATGEMVEYDPATFSAKQSMKLPADAAKSPANVSVNHLGQILFVPGVSLPLTDDDISVTHKVWFWNGHAAATIDQGVEHKTEKIGSNDALTEVAPAVYLAADGTHLFWFANQQRRLQRDDLDFSTNTTWQAWQTDPSGGTREDIASLKFPDCRCPTGGCEETCPSGVAWVPERGLDKFFLMTQFFPGKTNPVYKASSRYRGEGGKWTSEALTEPLQRVLDSDPTGNVIVEALPDTGCCGWSNQSNDQTLVLTGGKKIVAFDEQATYKNQDYDVSFYTSAARLSPEAGYVAITVASTAQLNKPIQQAEDGQANPEELVRIRKTLAELPAVAVKRIEDTPRQVALLPHATLAGWLNEKEILIVEDHLLVVYNISTGTRRRSAVKVEDAAHVFVR